MPSMSRPRRVAGGGGEGVPLDGPHPEALPLVEAQVADVGGRGRDQDQPHAFGRGQVDGGLDEPAPYPLSLAVFAYGHVLDLCLPRVTGAGQLEVADDLAVRDGDQDAAGVDVGVEFGGGIIGQLEQRPQAVPWPIVALDPYVVRRQGSLRFPVALPAAVEVHEVPRARASRSFSPIRPVTATVTRICRRCPVQQHALVPLADAEDAAHVRGRQPFHVAERDDLTLRGRQILYELAHAGRQLGRDHPVDGLVGPVDRGSGPPPVLAEPAAVVPELAVVDRQVLPLVQPGADRPVRHDAEQPRAQRRPTLETVEATEQPQPRVLRYLFGDRRAAHVATGRTGPSPRDGGRPGTRKPPRRRSAGAPAARLHRDRATGSAPPDRPCLS